MNLLEKIQEKKFSQILGKEPSCLISGYNKGDTTDFYKILNRTIGNISLFKIASMFEDELLEILLANQELKDHIWKYCSTNPPIETEENRRKHYFWAFDEMVRSIFLLESIKFARRIIANS